MSTRITKGRLTGTDHDPCFNYAQFWSGRDYEHLSEVIALRRLLRGRRFRHAIDVGGGFGRLSVILTEYADHVTLVDPSTQQLDLSRRIFAGEPSFDRRLMDAAHLRFADGSAELVTLIRVLPHLPDPEPEFAELSRVLRIGGYAVIEIANSVHAGRRAAALLRRQRPGEAPVDIRPERDRQRDTAPYVSHHPRVIARQLAAVGLQPRQLLSVSNLRCPLAKALLPERALLTAERLAQRPLGRFYLGPSVFFLLQKVPVAAAGRTAPAPYPYPPVRLYRAEDARARAAGRGGLAGGECVHDEDPDRCHVTRRGGCDPGPAIGREYRVDEAPAAGAWLPAGPAAPLQPADHV